VKVFISCDMEGVAGIVDWAQCRADGGAAYERGCALMLGEVNAAIVGAVNGGVEAIVVNDSHGAMANLDPEKIQVPATYISGRHKPAYMMEGLDETFDAVFFVGYHGSISGDSSVLSHTYNPEVITGVRLGGEYVGESGINALVAQAHGVPIALVTGDTVTLTEAERFAPGHRGVETKQSITRFAAHHLHPLSARRQITRAAEEAIQLVRRGAVGPPQLPEDLTLEVELATSDMAAVASWVKGVERASTMTVLVTGDGSDLAGLAVYDSFVALTYITRQAGGR
jgi:D-amino peptidase